MILEKRIAAFVRLKDFFEKIIDDSYIFDDAFSDFSLKFRNIIQTENLQNGWFTVESVKKSIKALSENLSKENIELWLIKYHLEKENPEPKKVGVILAGNLPLVGFQDFISVLITGNIFIGKMSSKDNRLLSSVSEFLIKIEPEFENYIFFEENQLKDIDAIIATGSNNSARYFEYYFGKYPNIIRKNRNSISILGGNETRQQIENLADDIFLYYGLGCRNVSKIFVPENFNLNKIFEGFIKYAEVINNNKYANNYTYNRAIYLMDLKQFYDNNFVILKESEQISSPIGVVYFEYYKDIEDVVNFVKINNEMIQCVSTDLKLLDIQTVKLGETQKPNLWDYADNIDTIEFLKNL